MSSLNSRHARVYIRHLTSQIVLIGLVGVVTLCPESTRASIERDSLRADVINYNHSDFPDYERIDKQRFLDDFDRFEGLHDTDTLIVRFQNGLDPENIARSLIYLDTGDEVVKNPSDVASAMSRIATTIQDYALISFVDITNDVPSDVMEKDRLEAEFFAGRQFPDLRLYFTIHLSNNVNPRELLSSVLDDESIEVAYYEIPSELYWDLAPMTPDFSTGNVVQKHLEADFPNGGLGARSFWGIPGGRGNGVRAAIYEFAATVNHEDFPTLYATVGSGSFSNYEDSADHGTATMGIIGARDNGYGTTGIAPSSSLIFAATGNLAALASSSYTRAGDIISISMGVGGCPIVNDPNNYDILQQAVTRGVLVFVSAGNDGWDIDEECDLNVLTTAVSVVGGGMADTDHNYWPGSNYGASIDLQGWYGSIVTTGDGDIWGNSHGTPAVHFPEYAGRTDCRDNKSVIPDGSIVLLADFDNSPMDGDDLVSCWPITGNTCLWVWTKNLTTNTTPNGGVQFGQTAAVGESMWFGNLTFLYAMDDFNGVGNDDLVYFDTTANALNFVNIAQLPTPVPVTVLLGQGEVMPTSTDQLFSADVNDDGLKDLVLNRQVGDYRQMWAAENVLVGTTPSFPYGFESFYIGNAPMVYRWSDYITFGDYDLDGIDDLIVARDGGFYGKEWFYSAGSGNGTFGPPNRIVVHSLGLFRSNDDSPIFTVTDILAGRLDADSSGGVDFISRNDADSFLHDNTWAVAWFIRPPISNANRQLYTKKFGGTSGAAPMVAGAAAVIQGVFRADGSSGCDQESMTYLLKATGEPQGQDANYFAGRLVGSYPNLIRAAQFLFLHEVSMYVDGALRSGMIEDIPFNGDIDGDGKDDVFFYRPSYDTFYYSRNIGVPNFAAPSAAYLDYSDLALDTVCVGDVDGDEKDDIVAKAASGLWLVLRNNTTITPEFYWNLSSVGDDLLAYGASDKFVLGDIDGDGMEDLIVRTGNTSSWEWARSNGTVFGAVQELLIGGSSLNTFDSMDQIRFADVNGDGFDDLVARTTADSWWVSMNSQDGSLQAPIMPVIDGMLDAYEPGDLISVGDYTGEGIADLFIREPSQRRWYLSKHVVGWVGSP